MEVSPASVSSRKITVSIYEKQSSKSKRNEYELRDPEDRFLSNSSKKPIFTSNYSELLNFSDLKRNLRTPKANPTVTKSISKMEDIQNRSDQETERQEFEKKLKEKYLRSLGFKKEISELDFNNKDLKASVNHCFSIALILLERTLNKCIIFEEEEIFFTNIVELIKHYAGIMCSFQRIYNSLTEENSVYLRKIASLSENLEILNVEKERSLMKPDDFSNYKNLMKVPLSDNNFKAQVDFIENRFNLENQKLRSEIEQLRKMFDHSKRDDKAELLEQELRDSEERSARALAELKKENTVFINKINNLEFTTNNQKTVIRNLELELRMLREVISSLEANNKELSVSNEQLLERARAYREISAMSHEETLSTKQGFIGKMDIIKRVQESYFSIQNKLVLMTNQQQLPKAEDFLQTSDLLSEVSQYFQHNIKLFRRSVVKLDDQSEDSLRKRNENNNEDEIKAVDLVHSIDLNKFRFYKPSFFSLIEVKYKQFELNGQKGSSDNGPNFSNKKPENTEYLDIHPHYISILRGILDSKWNEFLFYDNPRDYSSFTDFVYSWLGRFEINSETYAICPNNNQDADEDRCRFFKSLIHPVIDKHWESVTFREFLDEKSSNDEIYFYLYGRFLLFRGTQLQHSQGKFCFVHFVNYDRVIDVVEILFKSFEEDTIAFLKKKLKSKAKIKNNIVFLDSGFVLRMFLEYYRLERKHRFRLLQELFLVKSQSKLHLKFEEFKQIIEAFQTNVTDLEKAYLYREAFSVSQGKIDPETLFLVFSENNFFIRTIKTRFMNGFHSRRSIGFLSEAEGRNIPSDPKAAKIMNDFVNLEDKINDMAGLAGNLGLESLLTDVQNYMKMFKKNCENWEFNRGKSMLFSYFRFHETLMSVRNFEIFLKTCERTIKEEEILKTELFFFENVYNCIYKIKNEEIVKEMEENAQARKIQKWVQVRFSRWLKLLYTVFKVKIHHKKIHSGNTIYPGNMSNKSVGLKEKKN